MEENKRVLLGMSGGTDSSVAAMRLLEAGYEVIGVTFRFYELNGSTEYLEDARNLAERLGIRHITYDAREIFSKQIIEYFVQEYLAGRTPVPCILCNNYLKWPLLAKIADEMGVFYIATGHYAQNIQLNNTFYITYAADSDKDQTFFLWGLKQDILCRMLLPMGDITKVEARVWAAEHGFRKVATKKDSIGVCFCPMDYRTFLKNWLAQNNEALAEEEQMMGENQALVGDWQVLDGTTDITRTIVLGEVSDEQKTDYTLVLKGFIALSQAEFPQGTCGTQLDVLARQFMWKAGINYGHGTGHGVGHFLNVHEGPHQIRMNHIPTPLQPGMTITNEPGIYKSGRYGIRTENTMLVVPARETEFGVFYKFEPLTLCPIDKEAIRIDLLTDEEIEWLNSYHQRVYDTLSPMLTSDEQNWLKEATARL